MKEFWVITFSVELLENSLESYNKIVNLIESTCFDYFKINKLTYLVRVSEKNPYDEIVEYLDSENIYSNLLIFRTSGWQFWCNCDSKKVFSDNKELYKWLNLKK